MFSTKSLLRLLNNRFIVGYSLTGDNNGYDYGNTGTGNGYLGSKDSYQNGGSFYGAAGTSHISNHINSHSLINDGIQSVRSDVRNNYGKYSANDHGNEYSGYSKTYENSDSDSYTLPTHTASIPYGGYSGSNSNAESTLNAYSSETGHKDNDFVGQYVTGSSSDQRASPYPEYRPAVLENYSQGTVDSEVQTHHGSSSVPSYAESNRVYPPYLASGPTSDYSFGKQENSLYSLKGINKYGDIYSIPTETRYTRGNPGRVSHNHGVPLYLSGSGPSSHVSKAYGSGVYSSGKPYKYGYKYLSRYAPNDGVAYLSRERDGYYSPYGKDTGKVVIIKDGRQSYPAGPMYPDEPLYTAGNRSGYRSKSGSFMSAGGYPTSSNLDGYSGTSDTYDNGFTMPRRYRNGGHMFMQKTIYP